MGPAASDIIEDARRVELAEEPTAVKDEDVAAPVRTSRELDAIVSRRMARLMEGTRA